MKSPMITSRTGYTLIEILMAVTLSLILMYAVVKVFAMVGDYVTNSQAIIELDQKVRGAQMLLQQDLQRYTTKMTPPVDPAVGQGYFRYDETGGQVVTNSNSPYITTNLIGDTDDSLRFTIHDMNTPFNGFTAVGDNTTPTRSFDAEVYWYVANNKLYRRMLVLSPTTLVEPSRVPIGTVKRASLSDVTLATYRYGWITTDVNADVVLDNVIQFDVQAWDPAYRKYVNVGTANTSFTGTNYYDTGSRFSTTATNTNYTASNTVVGTITSASFENTPYPGVELRGIRIKIRTFEPTTGQVRDITVEQDFLTH